MKKVVSFIFLMSFAGSIYAGPFGFEMGMTLEQIQESCAGVEPQIIQEDAYYVTPINKHSTFETYIVFVNKKVGLYYIKAISYKIMSSKYGTEAKNAFIDIEQRISNIYGKSTKIDKINPDSIWKSSDYWMFALCQGDREYYCYWSENIEKSKDGINAVALSLDADVENIGYIILEYQFNNFEKVKDSEDSVL